MGLSKNLIDQFTKLSSPEKEKKPSVVNGVYKKINDISYVKLDGSNILTPVNILVETNDNDKVSVEIKNHSATVIGNISSPAANTSSVNNIKNDVLNQNNIILQQNNNILQQNNKITQINNTVNEQNNNIKLINNEIKTTNSKIDTNSSDIKSMNDTVVSHNNSIVRIDNKVTEQGNTIVSQGNQITQNGNNIQSNNNNITVLNSGFNIVDGKLTGLSDIVVKNLETDTLNTKYAKIDFANIGTAAVEKLFATSGIIKDLVVENEHITGELVGVTIKGDIIIGNTVAADKLVVKGSDGLYYKLNLDGEKIEAQQTDQNSLNGSIITAKSITATKINVSDLVAFNATIGGFQLTSSSINTIGKTEMNSDATGLLLKKDGQFYLGDNSSHVKFYKNTDNEFKLDISANEIHLGANTQGLNEQLETLNNDYSEMSGNILNNYTSLDNKINQTNNNLNNYATKGYADSINDNVTNIKNETYSKSEIDKKMWDGTVTKVSSLNGTFDNDGMHYYRKGTPTESTINEYGVNVKSAASGDELLFAGYDTNTNSTIVRTDNLITRNYFIIADHSRIQGYGNNGGGVFII